MRDAPDPLLERPLKAPASWPNNSLSTTVSGSAPQFMATKLPLARRLQRWSALATTSLPEGLAQHHHVDIGLGHLAHELAQAVDRRRDAQEGRVLRHRGVEAGAQGAVLDHQLAALEGAAHRGDQRLGRVGLGQEVVGAGPHRPDRHGDVAVAGDQDHRQLGIGLLQGGEEPSPSSPGRRTSVTTTPGGSARTARRADSASAWVSTEKPASVEALAVGPAHLLLVVDEDHAVGRCAHAAAPSVPGFWCWPGTARGGASGNSTRNSAAALRRGAGREGAAAFLDDAARDREAEAEAAGLGGEEGVEHLGAPLGQPAAVVAHLQHRALPRDPHRHGDARRVDARDRVEGVLHQVDHDLLQPRSFPEDIGRGLGQREGEVDPAEAPLHHFRGSCAPRRRAPPDRAGPRPCGRSP